MLALALAALLEAVAPTSVHVALLNVILRVAGLETELAEDPCTVGDDALDCCARRFSRKSRRPSSTILFLSS